MKLSSALFQFGRLSCLVGTCLALGLSALEAQANYQPRPRGLPAHRVSGGTRDPIPTCVLNPAQSQPLTALSPAENLGATTDPYPAFQWYIPANNASHLEFRLYEADLEQDTYQPVYQTAFSVSGKAGIATLQMPDEAGIPPLALDKTYYWTVDVYCESSSDQADMAIEGWVERIATEPTLQTELSQATTPVARAQVEAAHSLWYDATRTLTTQLQAQPTDTQTQQEWQQLLQAVGLDAIANAPFIQP